jgi:hypothetical protein
MARPIRPIALLIPFLLLFSTLAGAATPAAPSKPRLVVLISICRP